MVVLSDMHCGRSVPRGGGHALCQQFGCMQEGAGTEGLHRAQYKAPRCSPCSCAATRLLSLCHADRARLGIMPSTEEGMKYSVTTTITSKGVGSKLWNNSQGRLAAGPGTVGTLQQASLLNPRLHSHGNRGHAETQPSQTGNRPPSTQSESYTAVIHAAPLSGAFLTQLGPM